MNKSILALMLGAALWLPGCGSSGNFDAIANTGQNSAPPAPVEQQNGFSEMELLEPGAELEEGEVAMMFLEPPTGAEEMEPDSGPLGQDLVPVQIDSQQRLTLLLEPDTDELASAALRHQNGGVVLQVDPGLPQASANVPAGDYTLELNSRVDRDDAEDVPIFVAFEPTEVAGQSGGGTGSTLRMDKNSQDQNLNGIDLAGATINFVQFTGSKLRGADLTETRMALCNLDRCDLTGAQAEGARFRSCDASDAFFTGAVMRGASFTSGTANRTKFDNATLIGADLTGSQLFSSTFNKIQAPREEGFKPLTCSNIQADDSKWNGAVMPDVEFAFASLNRSVFTGATMPNAEFAFAKLNQAVFTGVANLTGASFGSAELDGVIGLPAGFP